MRFNLSFRLPVLFIFLAMCISSSGNAQQAKVLPYNGASSQEQGPQGAVRYQRQFYLITPDELNDADIPNGAGINSIGFAIALPQDASATGRFKVYLENTSDTISRLDTSWMSITISSNTYHPTNLFPANYEWQVRSLCTDSSEFSPLATFSNEALTVCYQPDSLYADGITVSGATLHWNALGSQDSFLLEYKEANAATWTSVFSANQTYALSGLTENMSYVWRVTSYCSGTVSAIALSSFLTDYTAGCTSPAVLMVSGVGDQTASLSWTSDPDFTRFDVRFRRLGTAFWINAVTFTESIDLSFGLTAGTNYEWQVRTVCDTSQSFGSFVSGPSFLTTGTQVCYAPSGLTASSITDTSAIMTWQPELGATDYELRIRPKQTISWVSAIAPMIFVHNDSILIPSTAGVYFTSFIGDSTFTYGGEGLYIAWEYANDSSALSSSNTILCNEREGGVVSFTSRLALSDTAPGEILASRTLRPETWLGTDAVADSVEVETIFAMGSVAIPFGKPTGISARVRNHSPQLKTYAVTLSIKDQESGQIRFSNTQMLSVDSLSSAIVVFPDWAPSHLETDSIIVSIPADGNESVVKNNRAHYIQLVNSHTQSYADNSSRLEGGSAGFGSGEGIILNRHVMQGCGKVIGVSVFLDFSAIGHTVFGVVFDTIGGVVAYSDSLVVQESDVNNRYTFYFANPPEYTDKEYYVGLGQTAGMGSYSPVSVQWEGISARPNAYFRANLNGSGFNAVTNAGRTMIYAELAASIPVPFIYGDEILCEGTSGFLRAGSRAMRYANGVVSTSSEFGNQGFSARKTLGVENVFPEHNLNSEAWMSSTADGQREYLILSFSDTIPINHIQIFETFNPGAIDSVFVKNPGTGNYEVVYTDSAAAIGDMSRMLSIDFGMTAFNVSEIKISINSPAVVGFNAIDAVAIGQQFMPAIYDTYLWSPGTETADSISISQDGTYSVAVSTGTCTSSATFEVVTPDSIVPTIIATGPTTFCIGGSVVLKSSETGGNAWSTGETTDSITVSATGTYTLQYNDGCNLFSSNAIDVIVNALPTVSVAGGTICLGETAILDAGAGFDQYLWSTGDSSQTISTTIAGLYRVTVVDTNGCTGSTFAIATVQIPPDPQIAGVTGYCPGDSTVLDAGGGYAQYAWSSGASSQMISVNSAGTFNVVVTDSDGCSGEDSVVVAEFVPPSPFIAGSLGICIGASTQLDAGGGFTTYLWSTGEITQTIFIDTAATFSVTVSDNNGCSGSASATTTMDGSIPLPPGPISGPQEGLCSATGVVYSIDPVPNATFYVWTVPTGVTIVSGEDSTSITVDMDSTFTGGDIIVAASNACGQSPSIEPTFITIQGLPNAPGDITGSLLVTCDYADFQYSIMTVDDATSYTWTVPEGAVITSGQGTLSIMVTFGNIAGDVCVTANNDCGNSLPNCVSVDFATANNLLVVNNSDSGAGSLRQLILDACWGDTIRFAGPLNGDTIRLTGAEIVIDKHVNIVGPGMDLLHLSGDNNSRVFSIQSGMLAYLNGLTIIDGFSLLNGGAFYNQGIATLSNVRFKNNFEGAISRAFTSNNKVIILDGVVETLQ